MPEGYGSHRDYMNWVRSDADARQEAIEVALRDAFSGFIERHEVEVVIFSDVSAVDLAKAMLAQPLILKSLLACCNVAGRSIERDLGIRNLDTYAPRLDEDYANIIAGYIKPFLPSHLELATLSQVDRIEFIDKDIRKIKGRWEQRISEALNRYSGASFRKRRFEVGGERFEIDVATPEEGDIQIGVDVKRIEARRDIHKRCDEISAKAGMLKSAYPKARFGAVLYYPFIEEHINIQNRLRSPDIDGLVFASESDESIENAVKLLISTLKANVG